jgi:hypothetical protein
MSYPHDIDPHAEALAAEFALSDERDKAARILEGKAEIDAWAERAESALAAKDAEIAALRGALEPFGARPAASYPADRFPDEEVIGIKISFGQLRRARAALEMRGGTK